MTAAREVAKADPSSVVWLFDQISGYPRFSPPTSDDVHNARRVVAEALARGDLVLLRPERRLRGPIVLPEGFVDTKETPPAGAPPELAEEHWFEARLVGVDDKPVGGLDVVISSPGSLKSFQRDEGLPSTGEIDSATKARLKTRYGH